MAPCPPDRAGCSSPGALARWPVDRAFLPPSRACEDRSGSRGSEARVFPDLIARLPKRCAHRVRSGGEKLVLLTPVLPTPPSDDDLDVGESSAEAHAQVTRVGEIARPDRGDTDDGRILRGHEGEDLALQGMRRVDLEDDGVWPQEMLEHPERHLTRLVPRHASLHAWRVGGRDLRSVGGTTLALRFRRR